MEVFVYLSSTKLTDSHISLRSNNSHSNNSMSIGRNGTVSATEAKRSSAVWLLIHLILNWWRGCVQFVSEPARSLGLTEWCACYLSFCPWVQNHGDISSILYSCTPECNKAWSQRVQIGKGLRLQATDSFDQHTNSWSLRWSAWNNSKRKR